MIWHFTFIYSKRSGTPAAEFEEQVPEEVKRVRLQALMDVQTRFLELNQAMEDKVYDIIVEGPSRTDEKHVVWTHFGQ